MSDVDHSTEGRVALVTGAGSGLGRAFAQALGTAGWRVALLGRRRSALAQTATGLAPGAALVLPTDVSDEAAVSSAFAAVTHAWGRLDVLVNNAGRFGPSGTPDQIDVAQWRETVEVNLTGMFLCARAAFAAMRAQSPQGGRIINNGSISAHVPRPGSIAYTATKHAVTGLTKSIALDGRAFDVRCSQVDIGNAATEMTAAMPLGVPQADGSIRPEPTMDAVYAADIVVHLAGLPLEVEVPFLTITAGGMPLIGRG
jgi:NAD(P)-dependent dehydrogenase (short-subunit alcohol dehydrogenase family)